MISPRQEVWAFKMNWTTLHCIKCPYTARTIGDDEYTCQGYWFGSVSAISLLDFGTVLLTVGYIFLLFYHHIHLSWHWLVLQSEQWDQCNNVLSMSGNQTVDIFIRCTQNQNIWKQNNFEIFGIMKTKLPIHDNQNLLTVYMRWLNVTEYLCHKFSWS